MQTSKRFQCARSLLRYRNQEGEREFQIKFERLKKGQNSPLHWALYWVDIHLTNLVFDECKDQIFWLNGQAEVPFDMSLYLKSVFEENKS